MNKSNQIQGISIIIPLYNEEKVFNKLILALKSIIRTYSEIAFQIIMVDDGSKDQTRLLMTELSLENEEFDSIFLSRNFGHQIAVSAGLRYADPNNACFIIDGDLQDPPELVMDFYEKIQSGYDVVYGVRKKRKEGIWKKLAYNFYYRILSKISEIDLPLDSGDFSMISPRVRNILVNMPEESRYLRGMRAWVGFKQYSFEYERRKREDGESKYTLGMLFKLAYNGIFNFSTFPIKLVTILGMFTLILTFGYLILTIIKRLFFDSIPSGFTALASLIILFGSIQLISIGVLGEYIIRIFFQSKERPLFIVDKLIRNKEIIDG